MGVIKWKNSSLFVSEDFNMQQNSRLRVEINYECLSCVFNEDANKKHTYIWKQLKSQGHVMRKEDLESLTLTGHIESS